MENSFIRPAPYFRMSPDHQQYPLSNQADAIARYAAQNAFLVVKTYSDSAKTSSAVTSDIYTLSSGLN